MRVYDQEIIEDFAVVSGHDREFRKPYCEPGESDAAYALVVAFLSTLVALPALAIAAVVLL